MINIKKIYSIISPGVIPFLLALTFLVLILLDGLFHFFSLKDMIYFLKEQYERHGLIIIVIAALLESLFMLGAYLPGSFAIVLSVILSDKTPTSLFLIGMASWIGFNIANIINYFLGKYGYYRVLLFLGKKSSIEKMKKWFELKEIKTIFWTSIHPNFLSLCIVAAGIAKARFQRIIFISAIALAFWITVWIIIASPFLKKIDVAETDISWYIVLILFLWGVINIIIEHYRKGRTSYVNKKPVE